MPHLGKAVDGGGGGGGGGGMHRSGKPIPRRKHEICQDDVPQSRQKTESSKKAQLLFGRLFRDTSTLGLLGRKEVLFRYCVLREGRSLRSGSGSGGGGVGGLAVAVSLAICLMRCIVEGINPRTADFAECFYTRKCTEQASTDQICEPTGETCTRFGDIMSASVLASSTAIRNNQSV